MTKKLPPPLFIIDLTEREETPAETYTYDNCGNRATMNNNGVVTNYNYDLNNRLLNTVTDGMTANFTYDANGNQLSDGTTTYTYDSFNRMTSAGATAFTYRPDGLRHSVTTNYIATTHIWDGANIVVDIMGANVVKYVRGIGLINSSAGDYYIFNANGDVVQLADSAGAVTRNYHYDAFGNELDPDKHDTNPFRYSGEYWDGTFKGVSDIWQTYPEYNTPYCVLKRAGTALNYTFTEQISIQNLPADSYIFDLSVEFFKSLGDSRNVQIKIFEDSKIIYDESFTSSVTKPINLVLSGGNSLTVEYKFDLQGAEEMASAAALRNLRRSTGTAEIYGPEMYYLRARFYDPATSRMLSEDPYWRMQRIYEYNPQGLNLYAYVMNNPIRYADPSGLTAVSQKSYGGQFTLFVTPQDLDAIQTAVGLVPFFTPLNSLGQRFLLGHRKIDIDYWTISGTIANIADLISKKSIFGFVSTGFEGITTIYDWLGPQTYKIDEAIFNHYNKNVWISSSRNIVDTKFTNAFSWMAHHMAEGNLEIKKAIDVFGSDAFNKNGLTLKFDPLTGTDKIFRDNDYYFFALNDSMHGYFNIIENALKEYNTR